MAGQARVAAFAAEYGNEIKHKQQVKTDKQKVAQANGGESPSPNTMAGHTRGAARVWVLRCMVLVGVVVALICVVALSRVAKREAQAALDVPPRESIPGSSLEGSRTVSQFSPQTAAERELEQLLQGENIDLALVNWLVAADIPEFQNMTRTDY